MKEYKCLVYSLCSDDFCTFPKVIMVCDENIISESNFEQSIQPDFSELTGSD